MKDSAIKWHGAKITSILNKHSGMTKDIIKQVPNALEDPIIVLKSQTSDSRIVMLGEVYDKYGAPVLVALELMPTNRKGLLIDTSIIVSAYGKDSDMAKFIERSEVLYISTDKKRTTQWFQGLRLQLLSYETICGPIGKITYSGNQINISGVPFSQLSQNLAANSAPRPYFSSVGSSTDHHNTNIIQSSEKSKKKNHYRPICNPKRSQTAVDSVKKPYISI
ncbi:MAG: hypothetical protein LBB74_02745 [Chitinispirillales bacterium]|jgi:hypothetical protein|nr:hypothetical protein [Chitinispirillales bacterium]